MLRKTQISFFFLTAWAAETVQTEEFIFQNVAYRPTVYKTGGQSNKCQNKMDIGHGVSIKVVYEKYFYEIRSWSDLEFLARQRPQNWTITCQTFSKIE